MPDGNILEWFFYPCLDVAQATLCGAEPPATPGPGRLDADLMLSLWRLTMWIVVGCCSAIDNRLTCDSAGCTAEAYPDDSSTYGGSRWWVALYGKSTLPPDDDTSGGSDRVAKEAGFSLHAGVSTEAHQRDKLERLCRYVSRPAVSEKHLALAPNGNVSFGRLLPEIVPI